jgi:hypothetical protein
VPCIANEDDFIEESIHIDELAGLGEKSCDQWLLEMSRVRARLCEKINGLTNSDHVTRAWVTLSVENGIKQLIRELSTNAYVPNDPFGPNYKQWHELSSDGYTLVPSELDTALVGALAGPYRRELRRKAEMNPAGRHSVKIDPHGRLFREVRALASRAGVLDVAARYRGHAMEVAHISLHFSDSRQRWYKDCYRDVEEPTSQLAYLHYDYEPGMLKAIHYLGEVSSKSGVFSYIPGSHRWRRSLFRLCLLREMDRQHGRFFPGVGSSFYYRPRFISIAERKRMMALPSLFHGSSHFGDDICDSDRQGVRLLAQERAVLDSSSFILFDGARGLHRGSIVEEGERWAFQIGLNIMRPRVKRFAAALGDFKGLIRRIP